MVELGIRMIVGNVSGAGNIGAVGIAKWDGVGNVDHNGKC